MQDEMLAMNLPVTYGWWLFWMASALALLILVQWGSR